MGIGENNIATYWTKRSAKYACDRQWGLGAETPAAHIAQVKTRAEFIFQQCPRDRATLDYGCGIGRYSSYFLPMKYLGVDIAEAYLRIARNEHPGYQYQRLASPVFVEPCKWQWEVFFTATVLQHCSDLVVDALFRNVAAKRAGGFMFSLYECAESRWTQGQSVGRTAQRYEEMLARHFDVSNIMSRVHHMCGADYAHILVEVK